MNGPLIIIGPSHKAVYVLYLYYIFKKNINLSSIVQNITVYLFPLHLIQSRREKKDFWIYIIISPVLIGKKRPPIWNLKYSDIYLYVVLRGLQREYTFISKRFHILQIVKVMVSLINTHIFLKGGPYCLWALRFYKRF